MGPVPVWAVWLFAACFLLIIVVLLLDYCVIRRNALGNNCCTRARQKRNPASAVHQKRSTNMLLNVWVMFDLLKASIFNYQSLYCMQWYQVELLRIFKNYHFKKFQKLEP
ncbi:unnamed protein product [Cylicostephanus goldi]|uniref:Uncharacterized protein n=1 Tax=Cylicostephanus goldi TaxID=71465 RepID=A0A3P7N413_CYLGO|nr:unnamed protein product [Cylicostephanus goldi]